VKKSVDYIKKSMYNYNQQTGHKKTHGLVYESCAYSFIWKLITEIGELYMFVREVMVKNQVGLHARPATFFIQKANEFKSSIWIEKEERRVNAKSLLGILSLGIVGGTNVKVIADGADEKAAVDALIDLVDSGFSEESR